VILLQAVGTLADDPTLVSALFRVLGLAVVAASVALAAAALYRWYTREEIPAWLATLSGAASVALYLNAVGLFQQAVGSNPAEVFDPMVVLINAASIGAAVVVSPAGRAVGDRLVISAFALVGSQKLDTEVSRLVSSVGRVRQVVLPETADEVDDIEGYEPVPEATKAELAGMTLLMPRGLRGDDLRNRLVTRIKEDYGVGYVAIDLADDGTVTRLGLGRRVAGVGPTLAPGFVAVAVDADPGSGASAGDAVQLWRRTPDASAGRVVSGELRAAVGDAVTIVLNEADAARLDPDADYRLLTLPTNPGAERDFTSLLRGADETMEVLTVGAGSRLDGAAISEVDATVAAVRSPDGDIEATPRRCRTLVAGETVYLVARPERIRETSRRAAASDGEPTP